MTEIKLIFRFNISEVVYPSIEHFLCSDKQFNIISSERIKNDFLRSNQSLANKINHYINVGELIPKEYWCSFWTAILLEDRPNVITSMIGNLDQFKEFEKHIEMTNFKLTEIIYLKINDISKLTELAKQKYSKIYDNTEALRKDIENYQMMREETINYSQSKYKIIIDDFFSKEIRI